MPHPQILADLQSAIDRLLASRAQDSTRLNGLADLVVRGLQSRGLVGARGGSLGEVSVRGFGRAKAWDVSWIAGQKPRVLVSLKSILKNFSGTVPNRLDDLMGEVANVQLLFPEVVIGYITLLDEAANSERRADDGHGDTWADHFQVRAQALARRGAPAWGAGLIEALWVVKIDSRRPVGERCLAPDEAEAEGQRFLDSLVTHAREREPSLIAAP